MTCNDCNGTKFIKGTLEGTAFEPLGQSRKWFTSGVYGVIVEVCSECGAIRRLSISVDEVNKIISNMKRDS